MDAKSALRIALHPEFQMNVVGAMRQRAGYSISVEQPTDPGYILAQQLLEGTYKLEMWVSGVVLDSAFLALDFETVKENGEGVGYTDIYNIVNAQYGTFAA